ncbi:von willebrand factor type A domain-containing protein [Ditylenchus destructor]|uniref:von willebrand factor type A domain-containing protein n=1 Tax=Ditylenchus destructor TaxID=166010 RepID=A0AAD4N3V9_9BILA|nr:von willebrand factor type A domain-containing protein [Ditylenchus destructor]
MFTTSNRLMHEQGEPEVAAKAVSAPSASPPSPSPSPPPPPPPPPVSCGVSDVLFVLDSTGSVGSVYEAQRSYISQLAGQLNIGPETQHAGLILYSSKPRQVIVVGLNESISKDAFIAKVNELPYHGGVTATGSALALAQKALESRQPGKKAVVIVLTDGFSFDNTKPASDGLHALPDVTVVVAGTISIIVKPVLEEIAGDPSRVLLGEENKAKVAAMLSC